MFMQYFIPGATVPILSHYLKNHLGFSALQIGTVMAMFPLAGSIAMGVTAHLADRRISAERLYALCHFAGGVLMLLFAAQSRFMPILTLFFLYGFAFAPTFGLSNTIVLHQMADAKRDFGGVRLWGTVGWMAVAWVFGYIWLSGGPEDGSRMAHAFILNGTCSIGMGIFSLTLPHGNHQKVDEDAPPPLPAFKLLRRHDLRVLCAATVLSNVIHQFYYFGMGPYLSWRGFADEYIMPAMSLGQVSEVFVMLTLGWCIRRLGMKRAMVVGTLMQAVRMAVFALCGAKLGILGAICLHGICFTWFFMPAFLYADQHCTRAERAGAQQIITMMITLGSLFGSYSAGLVAKAVTPAGETAINFALYWWFPITISCVTAALFALFFRESADRG